MPVERIKVDLVDPNKKDNQKFVNLFDEGKWRKLIDEYNGGLGQKSLAELFKELLESR